MEASLDFAIYSIKAVSHVSGVTEPTLRAWEKRYNVLVPHRTDSNHRRYTKRDILRVIWLRQRLEEGMSISQASTLLQTQPDETLLAVNNTFGKIYSSKSGNTNVNIKDNSKHFRLDEQVRSPERVVEDLLTAFLSFEEHQAEDLLAEAAGLYPPEQLCLNIIQPVLTEIGERWMNNEVTVATEHFATAICRNRLNAMFESLPIIETGPLILTACAPQEFHELGIIISTYFLRRNGWRVIYLGQNVPAIGLDKDLRRLRPALICFSASRTEAALALRSEIGPIIEGVRQSDLPNLYFAYSGRAFQEEPELHDIFKDWVYFGDDARQSIRLLDQLHLKN